MTKLAHSFKPSLTTVKARIENLIERDFMSVDETDKKLYNYVA